MLLVDGTYDAFIVWADTRSHDHNDDHSDDHSDDRDQQKIAFDLAITSGEHKGDVVEVVASNFATRDPIDLVGLPCTLVVANGEPRIVV